MHILGISAFYHDSAAVLLRDGKIVAAAQEERFTRKKHDASFPRAAIEFCLQTAAAEVSDLDYVVFYEKPLLKFDRLIETYLSFAPFGFMSFRQALPLWLREKLFTHRVLDEGLKRRYPGRFVYTEHHESHAASAFFPSPFEEAAIITMDGVGEWATATIGVGAGNRVEILQEIHFPHSLGLLYSAFTHFAGFKVNSGEYKLMGLAPYGSPRYADQIRRELIDIKEDGSFSLNMAYFNYCQGLTMTGRRFHQLFGSEPREPETPITEFFMDIAASVQQVTEEVMLKTAAHAHRITGKRSLCLAGGVALNCVGNGKILNEGPFEQFWIQPASGDAGGALGAAQFVWYQLLDNPRKPGPSDQQRGSLLGPRYASNDIVRFLEERNAVYQVVEDEQELCEMIAELLAGGQVVGWFQGRMEFGPRALGSRSILGDPRSDSMQKVMNLKIKFRESFRPFAPAVLREKAGEFFEVPEAFDSPYMLIVAPVRQSRRSDCAEELKGLKGFEKLPVRRSELPAVTHVDFSARVQTVDAERHPRFHRLLSSFEAVTGCPVLINTSFNVRGEPIVCSPDDAYRCFMATDMDVLVLEDCVLLKKHQPSENRVASESHLAQFELD
ncbi:MAG: carbamoyltransferase [Acidobacteriota bacterium]|nr:MAG: carbamoyltransferase [Acidobacteriota bacterium]